MRHPDAALDLARLHAFAARHYRERPDRLGLRLRAVRSGLEAGAVARVEVSFADGRPPACFAAKYIADPERRELAAYRMLGRSGLGVAPRLLGVDRFGRQATCLYLEWVDSCCRWPWRDPARAGFVLEQLARVHSAAPAAGAGWLAGWDYETELRLSAESTLEAFASSVRTPELAAARCRRRMVERIVAALPAIRRRLLENPVLLHGDAHSGNVAVRRRGDCWQAVLFDWSRVRLGSPLEDVSSWLQSLGYWEWEARRRHDTLLRRYLEARGLPAVLTGELRDLYWLAGASNALAGALRYHLWAAKEGTARRRAEHARAACDWLRILRRADLAIGS